MTAGIPLLGANLIAPALAAGDVDQSRLAKAEPDQWLANGRDTHETRFSPLASIDRDTVVRLGFAWEFRDFVARGGIHRGIEANPIFVDGVLYFSGPWGIAYAVDARSGKHLWTFDPHGDGAVGRAACCDVVSRGIAVWQGRVFVASLAGTLFALDAATGKELWRADTIIDHGKDYTVPGAPHMAGDKVLIGNAGSDMGARGYVSAYDGDTGKLAWRFYATPGDPAKGPDETPDVTFARKTWSKESRWDMGAGGNPWDAMAYDPALNLAYIGFGNGGPHPAWVRSPGEGDTLFTSSIVAVDATTGRMTWYYQETPRDSWDYDATTQMILIDQDWQGTPRKLLVQAPKNGIFYVLDRETGQLLKADPFTTVSWTDGVDLETGRPHISPSADYSAGPRIVWPGAPGGHSWQPMSFDPETHYVYLPVYDVPMKFAQVPKIEPVRGDMFALQGETGTFPPYTSAADQAALKTLPKPVMETHLKAWDFVAGKAAWVSDSLPFISGGVLTTAGGLLFESIGEGQLSIYDASNGKVLKRIQTGTAIMAAPISYAIDGVQYVAVMAGAGGPQGAAWAPTVAASKYDNFERLLVFKLDGGLVPFPPAVKPPEQQPTPAPIQADAVTLDRGQHLFIDNCVRCHLIGGAFGMYPNLWNLPPEAIDAFESIVYDGALRDGGMAPFSDVLSKDDVAAIKAFIVDDEIKKREGGAEAGAHANVANH